MKEFPSIVAVLIGFAVRLAIPILATTLLVYVLRQLDAHWQSEARNQPKAVNKPACWEVMGCSPENRNSCPGYLSALPCWQARRTANGYLREACLACRVFRSAPVPA